MNFTGLTHMGRLGEFAELAAAADCMVILTSGGGSKNSGNVTPFGGAQPALSTNPIAVGVPTGDDEPFILDFATSIVAGAKVRVALNKGVDVPEGWIVDKHGNPTTNPADFEDGGYLLPFGGHKGYAPSAACLPFGRPGWKLRSCTRIHGRRIPSSHQHQTHSTPLDGLSGRRTRIPERFEINAASTGFRRRASSRRFRAPFTPRAPCPRH